MTAGQLRTLKKLFEELLSFDGTKSAKDKLVERISSLYECLGKQATSDEFQNVYELGELSTHIFKSARKEVIENDTKWVKEQGKENKTKFKTKMFELSIYHMKNCCQKHLDSNNVLWIPYCLSVLEKAWVRSEVSMEAEIATCLSLCASFTDLRWAEHKHVQRLWEFTWSRIADPQLDMAILKQYVELAVRIMQNVDISIFEISPFHLVEKVIMTLKTSAQQADSYFWTHSRKYSFVYILSHVIQRWGIEGRDLILREIFYITDHLQSLISVEVGCESKACMMQLIDDVAKLAVVERIGEHRTISERIENKLIELLRSGVTESLRMAHSSFFSKLQFSIPNNYVKFIAHWMLILRDSESQQSSSKSIYTFDALTTLSFGEHITPESHKCNAWNGAVELLIQMIASRKLDTKTVSQIVSNLWMKRKSFTTDMLGSSFCSLLALLIQDENRGLKFGECQVPSIDMILKYALSLMPKVTSLANSAHLVECILRFQPTKVPREMLRAICDTVSRTSPSSFPVLRLISAFISTTEFEESARFSSINKDEQSKWSLRKDILNWLLAEPNSSSHQLIYQLCQYHPTFCYDDDREPGGVEDQDSLLEGMEKCRLISSPSTSKPENFRPIDVSIEEMVRFVHDELQFLLGAELSLPVFILCYEFSMKHDEVQFEFRDIYPKLERIIEGIEESEFVRCVQQFTCCPKQLSFPSKFARSEKCHVEWLIANLENQQVQLEPQIFRKQSIIDEIARRVRCNIQIRARFQQAMPFNRLVKHFIMENPGDLYQTVHRFERYSFLLSHRNLFATRAKILEIAVNELENDGVVYEADVDLFESMTRSVCIKNVTSPNRIPGFNLDPYVVALHPNNVIFNDRNVIKCLKMLGKSPFLGQNIVRHVMENRHLWHLHARVLKYVVKKEKLLSVCIATIPNMIRYLKIYQVHFDSRWRNVQFLRLKTESIDRCRKYMRSNTSFINVEDVTLLFGLEKNKWRRAISAFWQFFESEPALTSEVLHKYASDCIRLSLSGRLAHLLKALSTSELCRKVLFDRHLATIFGLVNRSIFSMIIKYDPDLVELCQESRLRFDVFEHRLRKIPSNLADDFMQFQTDIAFSVERFLQKGIESEEVNYLDFELIEFYRQLNENMTEEVAKSTRIIDFLSSAYQLLPSVRSQILPIVARFKHVSPGWEKFPQPPHYSDDRINFVWKLRFHVACRLMQSATFKSGEISSCVMLLLTSFDARFYRENLLGEQQLIRLKNGVQRNVLCVLSRILRQETRSAFTEELSLFEAATRTAALFPDIALCVIPHLFKACVDIQMKYDFAVGKLLECLKGVDKKNRQVVHCLAECVDAMGLNVLARYERLPDGDHPQFGVRWFFVLARLFVDHGFLTHAFSIANIIFDRTASIQRNIMMIERIPLDSLERGDEIIDLLVDIYVAEDNSMALSSLPPRVQTRPEVRKVMHRKGKEWLRLLSSDELTPRESTIFRWLCGLRCENSDENEKFLDAMLKCQFTEYPKQIDSPPKFAYFLLYHRELNTDVSFAKSEILGKLELSTDDLRLLSLADDEALFDPRSIEEHIVQAVRDLRDTFERRKQCDMQYAREINEKTQDMMTVARLLCENKAHHAASTVLKKWKEECVAWNHPSIDETLVEIAECDVMCQAGDIRMAETQLRRLKPKSEAAIAEWTMVSSRITLEYRNDLDEGIRLLEKGCKKLRDSPETKIKILLKFHSVCMDQLSKLEEYRESRTFRMKTEAISVFESQINSARTTRGNSSDSGESRKAVQRVRKEQQCEKDDVDKVERSVLSAAHKAVSSAFDALECIGQLGDEKEAIRTASLIVFPLIDVIYKYEQCTEIVVLLREHIRGRITTKLWVAATSHIASKTFSMEPSPIQRYLYQLLCLLIFDYPYHVLHTVLMYEYGKNGSKARTFLTSAFEMEKNRDMKTLREILANMREAHAAYRELTQIDTKGNIRLQTVNINGKPMLRMPADLRIFKCKLRQLPIPTITQKIGRPGDYSTEHLITWKSWKDVFTIADGLSAPKVWEIQGSDGKWYRTVWKKDDVRQDVLVEQMFDVTNNMFERSMLRTYNVVPLDTECGIIEFCGGTVSIKEMLCGASREGGLHREFNPREESAGRVSSQMREVQSDSAERRREVFVDICKKYSPVFRHFFYTNFPTAHIWRAKINEYRRSLATWSIVCYIVGLGDRHASNILFDQKLCTFVHIDLGMILEYSKRSLPVPEQVPFRVSRDLLDPLLIEGIENGQLADDCTRAMETLKQNGKVILGVASALLRETMTNFRETEQASGRPSYISEMAIGRLREKLQGTDEGVTPQASSLQVRRLLRDATNADNLSRMFCGWMPFL